MSEVMPEGMSFAEAKAALEADESTPDPGFTANPPAPVVPEQAAAPSTPTGQTEVQPETPDTPSLFEGSQVNPDELIAANPELAPLVKQLQGVFTQKTQEVAEQRKQFEQYGEPEAVQSAVELYQSLQDPEYLQAFHGELTQVLESMGLSPAEASAQAAQQIAESQQPAAAPELTPDLQQLVQSDPELAPIAKMIAEQRAELQSFKDQQAAREQALEQERYQMALAGEIDRMDRLVRESHPEYSEDDMNAIYERASFYDGNVLQAAEMFEADRSRIIEGYLSQKQGAASTAPVEGAGTVTAPVQEDLATLNDAQAAAEAWLSANDATDLSI